MCVKFAASLSLPEDPKVVPVCQEDLFYSHFSNLLLMSSDK